MKDVWIASHRGCFGGNIVENSLQAFEAALFNGADIVETDLHKTKDGRIVLFHDVSTMRMLGIPGTTEDYTLKELREQELRNVIGEPSGVLIPTLDEFLERFKGRCMINLDQCADFADEVYEKLLERGMENQALIKGRVPYEGVVEWLRKYDFVPKFIPIITKDEEMDAFRALPEQINIPIVEVFIQEDDSVLVSEEFVRELEGRGIRLWVNALDLGRRIDMSAMHNDTVSVLGNPDAGWGWLIDHGARVIQTDWPAELNRYLSARGLRK